MTLTTSHQRRIPVTVLETRRSQGLLLGMDACEYLGLPRTKEAVKTLYNARKHGYLTAQILDGNYYFSTESLDAYNKHKQEKPIPHVPIPIEEVELEEVELEEVEAYAEMFAAIQATGLRALRRMQVTRWRKIHIEEVETLLTRTFRLVVTLPDGMTRREVQVSVEGGQYHALSEDVQNFLEARVKRLEQELTIAQQKAQLQQGIKKLDRLTGWHDPTLMLEIFYEALPDGQYRISSRDFPQLSILETGREEAQASYRLHLRGLLCALQRHEKAGYELKYKQEAQLDQLRFLFDELE